MTHANGFANMLVVTKDAVDGNRQALERTRYERRLSSYRGIRGRSMDTDALDMAEYPCGCTCIEEVRCADGGCESGQP